MSKNIGKIFEQDIQNSVPENILLYRLPDFAQSFYQNNVLRFSLKNPFDYLLWDSEDRLLCALELKTVAKKSISFERDKKDKGIIHHHQIEGLTKWNQYKYTVCGFIIEFRELEKTIFLEISEFNKLIQNITKKSFTLSDIENNNIQYYVIEQTKLRTHYKYNIEKFLSYIRKNYN